MAMMTVEIDQMRKTVVSQTVTVHGSILMLIHYPEHPRFSNRLLRLPLAVILGCPPTNFHNAIRSGVIYIFSRV